MSKHLILVGDSVFDNGAYILPDQADVKTQLKSKVDPMEWWVDLRARDGDYASDISRQISIRPIPRHSTFVLSVGGNDALGHIGILQEHILDGSMASALLRFREIRENFRKQYVGALNSILVHDKPLIVCTIYNPKFPEADKQAQSEAALSFFNDVITEEAIRRSLPIIDLRHVCSDPNALANPIEPSELGGDLITDAIISLLSPEVTASTETITTKVPTTNMALEQPVPPYASPGASWSIEEERLLYEAYKSQLSCGELAKQHGRTKGAITSCLQRLGLRHGTRRKSPYPEFTPASIVDTIEEALEGEQNYSPKNPSPPSGESPPNSVQVPKTINRGENECSRCGGEIPIARLDAVPGTTLCIKCASGGPSDDQKRFISEPLGSREDYKKDRASWKKTNT